MPKTKGKITVACECGETLEVPASIKGEFDCTCGKTYAINKEKVVEKGGYPIPYPVYPQPLRPYVQPWDRYQPYQPTGPIWVSTPNTSIGVAGRTTVDSDVNYNWDYHSGLSQDQRGTTTHISNVASLAAICN